MSPQPAPISWGHEPPCSWWLSLHQSKQSGPVPWNRHGSTYALEFLDVVIGENVRLLQVLVGVEGLPHQCFPEGGQEVQRQRDVCTDGYAQQLAQEVQQLLLAVGDGAGRQDVLALWVEAAAVRTSSAMWPAGEGAGAAPVHRDAHLVLVDG